MKTMSHPSVSQFGTPRLPAGLLKLLLKGECASSAALNPFVPSGHFVFFRSQTLDDNYFQTGITQTAKSTEASWPENRVRPEAVLHGAENSVTETQTGTSPSFSLQSGFQNDIIWQSAGITSLVPLVSGYLLSADMYTNVVPSMTTTVSSRGLSGSLWWGEGNEVGHPALANLTWKFTESILLEVTNETSTATEEDLREMESDDFLEKVYIQTSSGQVSAAMDAVIDHVDLLLNDGFFGVCNQLLANVRLDRLPSSIRRAFLMVTKPAKDKLPARASFFEEALRLLSTERGEETARKMLKPLA